jgi:rhomboid protease GluP
MEREKLRGARMGNGTPEDQQQPEHEPIRTDRPVTTFGQLLAASTPRYFVVPILIGLNVAIFMLMALSGVPLLNPVGRQPTGWQLFDWGANYGPATLNGQWWRLLSSTFIHGGIIHLVFNMQCLWQLGKLTERLYGNWTFLLLYILSGLGASAASLLWNPVTLSVGSSGAVFGVAGGLVAFLYLGKLPLSRTTIQGILSSTLIFVGYSLLYGATSPGIDNAAHIGGLVVGVSVGALLTRPLPPPEGFSRLPKALIAMGLALLLVLGTLFLR